MCYQYRWRRPWLCSSLCTATLLAALTTTPSSADQITMEAASAKSLVSLILQSMTSPWRKSGVDVELSMNQTLTKSLLKLAVGKLDAAIVPPLAYTALKNGEGPYKKMGKTVKTASQNVRALFGIPASIYHAIVWADSGIETWEDAKRHRVYMGPIAGIVSKDIRALAAAGGIKASSYTAINAPWGAAAQHFQEGKFDVYVGAYGMGSKSLSELSQSRDIRLLSVTTENQEPPAGFFLKAAKIPPNTYPGQVNNKTVLTWQALIMMTVHKDLSDETAYQLTKTYFESREELAKNNAVLAELPASDPLAGITAPLHPGALRYYEESRIPIPEHLVVPR